MSKLLIIVFCIFILSSLSFSMDIAGSSTIQPIVTKAGKVFQNKTGFPVNVRGGGSGYGSNNVIQGLIDIGACSRELKKAETEAGLIAYTIGFDGIGIIVNAGNPLDSITNEQVKLIYSGQILNWKVMNNIDDEIIIVSKEEGRSTKELFEKFFDLKDKVVENTFLIGSNTEDIAFISGDPYAIGYVSIGSAEYALQKGIKIKLLKLEGIDASKVNVKNKIYPLTRPLNLVTKGTAKGIVKNFIDFILSKEGQKIVEEQNFIKVQ